MVDDDVLNQAATDLLGQGYALIPCDTRPEANLAREFKAFCDRYTPKERARWTIQVEERPDSKFDPDDGYIGFESGAHVDYKHIFHFREDFWDRWKEVASMREMPAFTEFDKHFLQLARSVYREHHSLIQKIATAIDGQSNWPFSVAEVLAAAEWIDPPVLTSRSVLRLLNYPAQETESVARVHLDRSFLTLHPGGQGGQLVAHFQSGTKDISPPENHALVFWGQKAEMYALQNDIKITPLAHSAVSPPKVPRQAVVSFWHIALELWDARRP